MLHSYPQLCMLHVADAWKHLQASFGSKRISQTTTTPSSLQEKATHTNIVIYIYISSLYYLIRMWMSMISPMHKSPWAMPCHAHGSTMNYNSPGRRTPPGHQPSVQKPDMAQGLHHMEPWRGFTVAWIPKPTMKQSLANIGHSKYIYILCYIYIILYIYM